MDYADVLVCELGFEEVTLSYALPRGPALIDDHIWLRALPGPPLA